MCNELPPNEAAEDHGAIPAKYIRYAKGAVLIWCVVWIYLLLAGLLDSKRSWLESLASVGDAFGPLSAFLSAAAVFTGIVAAYVQIHEFRNQLKEMSASSAEMKKQTETYEAQLVEAKNQTKLLKMQVNYAREEALIECLPFFVIKRLNGELIQIEMDSRKPVFDVEIVSPFLPVGVGRNITLVEVTTLFPDENRKSIREDKTQVGEKLPMWTPGNKKLYVGEPKRGQTWKLRYRLAPGLQICEEFDTSNDVVSSDRTQQIQQLRSSISDWLMC